jgi:hypothetical protein
MAEMTRKEADALDALWTRTTPKIRVGEAGFSSENALNMP